MKEPAKAMKAFVAKGIGEVGFVEKAVPTADSNGAIIKTRVASLGSWDVRVVKGYFGNRSGITLGCEAVGEIYSVGSNVRGFKVGDRVAVSAITPCFKCENCQRGFPSQCRKALGGWRFGYSKDGVLAEYFYVNDAEANISHIPDRVSDEAALYATQVISSGLKAAENAGVLPGGTVAIFGQGPIGLMATAGCRLLGASLIIAVDSLKNRLELSREYGADIVINFQKEDPVREIMALTGGEGVDCSIEAVGSRLSFKQCIEVTGPGGTISVAGHFEEGEYLNIPRVEWGFGMSEKTVKTLLCPGGRERLSRMLRLIQNGRVDPTRMTTHRFSFEDVSEAFRLLAEGKEDVIRPVIYF